MEYSKLKYYLKLSAKWAFIMAIIFVTLPVNFGIAFWIGEQSGNTYYGFFVTSSFYILIMTLLYIFRKPKMRDYLKVSTINYLSRKRQEKTKAPQLAS